MGQATQFDSILRQYYPEAVWHVRTGASGMNNTTRYVRIGEDQYVLRVYETHRDADKVAYEHHVLSGLREQVEENRMTGVPGHSSLPVPHPVQAMDGSTMVRTPEGKLAVLFHYREGSNPRLRTAEDYLDFGRATGALSRLLKELRPDHDPIYRACYELALPTSEEIRETVLKPCLQEDSGLSDLRVDLEKVAEDLETLHRLLPVIASLPHQLIHGDLNASNVLAGPDNRINAFLDFEFVAWDLRVMELSVSLSEAMPDAEGMEMLSVGDWANMAALIMGFSEQVPLNRAEADLLPLLVQLRKVDVFIHFLNRWRDGVDSLEHVRMFLGMAGARHDWIKQNGQRLIDLVPYAREP